MSRQPRRVPDALRYRTRQRETVLAALARSDRFLSAKELHRTLVGEGARVSLSTVYRILTALGESGHADVIHESSGERRFLIRDTRGHRHFLVCRGCGLSIALDTDAIEIWADQVASESVFTDVEHTIELAGLCARCVKAHQQPRTSNA